MQMQTQLKIKSHLVRLLLKTRIFILIKVLLLARLGAILSPLVRALEIATDKSSIRFLQPSDPDSGRINGFVR